MAADLHIHIIEDDETLKCVKQHLQEVDMSDLNFDESKIYKTPHVWIGEVSWLKAELFGDEEKFVPGTIAKISEIIPEIVEITEEFVRKVVDAFNAPNKTDYNLNDVKVLEEFLLKHLGKKAFCILW